jgi:hypothetical protein
MKVWILLLLLSSPLSQSELHNASSPLSQTEMHNANRRQRKRFNPSFWNNNDEAQQTLVSLCSTVGSDLHYLHLQCLSPIFGDSAQSSTMKAANSFEAALSVGAVIKDPTNDHYECCFQRK